MIALVTKLMDARNLVYCLAAVLGILGSVREGNATCLGTVQSQSPDGQLIARITRTGHTGCGESRVKILDQHKHVLASTSYGSKDSEHGLGIENAAWTPDSLFFIFSASSSGGHQADHFPTFVFARQKNMIMPLEHELQGYVTDPDFRIVPPHDIEVFVSDGSTRNINLENVAPK